MRIFEIINTNEERKFKTRVIVVDRKNGKTLFLKRKSSYKDYPGFLDFPGGGNLKNELPTETAQRELYEETGIEVDRNDLIYVETFKRTKKDIHVFKAFTTKQPRKEFVEDEHENFIWLTINQIKKGKYNVMPQTKRLIKKALGKFLL